MVFSVVVRFGLAFVDERATGEMLASIAGAAGKLSLLAIPAVSVYCELGDASEIGEGAIALTG
jgi:hypothetical protein